MVELVLLEWGGLTPANIKSTLHVGGDLKTNSHITASGNISASGGDIIAGGSVISSSGNPNILNTP